MATSGFLPEMTPPGTKPAPLGTPPSALGKPPAAVKGMPHKGLSSPKGIRGPRGLAGAKRSMKGRR